MVSMSHLWGLEGPVTGQSQTHPGPTSGTTAGDSHAATASPAPASAPVTTGSSTLDVSPVSPGSDPPPGVTWTESSGMVSVASLKTSELQSVAWWDWKFPVDMLTRLPEMFCGLSKVYRGSMISVDFQGNRKFRTALQRKNWWCSIPKNSAQLRSTQIPTAFKEFRTWMYLTCSALCFLPQIDVSPKTGDPRYPQFQRIITMFPSKKKETRMVGRPTMSSWT